MKRRIVSIIAAFALTASAMPMSVTAASVGKNASNSITDVKTHITIFGTHYITYNFNGMIVDSRNAATNYNRMAFELMSNSDKDKVANWYWPGADRTEQFGESGVQAICDYVNDKKGWARGWKIYQDKLGNKYIPELREFYGGVEAEDDSQSLYNKEIDRLTSFDEGTAAYTLLTQYNNYDDAGELLAMYYSIPEMMKTGKAAYDACVNAYYMSVAAGTKAMSTYILNTIVDNCMVPGTFAAPSATLAGARTAGYTMVLTARNVIRDRIGKITGYSHTFMDERAREAIAGGGGTSPEEGAKAIKQYQKIINENYTLATYCHKQAENFQKHIESNAQSVLNEIEANQKKYDDYNAKRSQEQQAKYTAAENASNGVSRGGSYYIRIKAKEPTADPNENYELYSKQYDAWVSEVNACTKEFEDDFAAWEKDAAGDLASLIEYMGYDVVTGMGLPNAEITDGTTYFNLDYFSRYPYAPQWMTYFWESQDMENFSEELFCEYPNDYGDDTMQLIENEAQIAKERYQNAISKRDEIISSAKSLYSKHESEFRSLYAKAKGIADAWGLDLSAYQSRGAKVLKKSVDIENWMNEYKDGNKAYWPYTSGLNEDYFRVKINRIDKNMQILREKRADYKEQVSKKIDDYVELQRIDDALISEYNEIVEERNAILDSAPDYVKEQGLTNYRFKNVWIVDPDVYTLNSRNSIITSKLGEINNSISWEDENAYEKRIKARNAFFKQEADKLEPMYEKLTSLDRQREYIGYIEGRISSGMYWTYSRNSLNEYNLGHFGLDDNAMHYGTKEDFDYSFNTEEYDRSKRAMKLLLADFRGTAAGHMKFMSAYDSYKSKRSTVARALQAGTMTSYGANNELYSPLRSAYNSINSSSYAYSFSGPNINIGEEGEMELSQMYYTDDSEVQQVLKIAEDPESYVPVEGISSDEMQTMSETTLSEGESIKLSVTVSPKNATFPNVHWESLSPEVADVDENGRVTAYSEGTAAIRAVAEDAPLIEVADEDGNVTGYEVPDEFTVEFTINVVGQYSYDKIGDSTEGEDDEMEDAGYSWANYGTAEEPRYTSVTADGDKTTVSARFNSNGDGSTAIMAVYNTDGGLIGVSLVNNTGISRELSVSFNESDKADRVKIFTWYGTHSLKPYFDTIIDEEIIK